MDFSTLQTEVFSRGFDYLDDSGTGLARVKRWLNQAYLEICEAYSWPFLDTTTSGTAPLTISDLRQVLYVLDTSNDRQLQGVDVRHIADIDSDVSTTGTPQWYWLDGLTTVKVYPTNTSNTLSVRYLKTPVELSANGDEPVIPARFQDLIVDLAVLKGMKDSDNYEAVGILRAEVDRGVQVMANNLLERMLDAPDFIVQSEGWKNY